MNWFLRTTFWLKRKLNDGFPSRDEVDYWRRDMICDRILGRKVFDCMALYAEGKTLSEISVIMTCTRERARQMILKGVNRCRAVESGTY